jgi:Uma2 family endonuclease
MAISLRLAAPPDDHDILELSRRNPGFQFERSAAGELIVTPTSGEAGRRGAALTLQLGRWAEQAGGVVFGPSTGFRLPDGSLLSPDASWMPQERWAALTPEQQDSFAPLCPDAVFEIASKSDSLERLRVKMRAYLANGARLAVLIDPQRRAVEVYLPDRDVQIIDDPRSVPLDVVLPGFVLDPAPIFGETPGA